MNVKLDRKPLLEIRDGLLQFVVGVYLIFRIIISQLCACIFSDDSKMTWIIFKF